MDAFVVQFPDDLLNDRFGSLLALCCCPEAMAAAERATTAIDNICLMKR
jgi:hypothetical protein